ncbi:exopolysaccharide biosynthesis polyprenyl glycosylphosphotransferase [Aquimarina sp. 2201CG5-10]|uniref:exopolysaccharide biosynthesis polyprenyl glycosylphosphotransferase n=1 Tax=Aquimarina callyspongiae TaxID=3098150 RepID=UPI002AB37C80|nr:exopolysaccharide biosynthesis polyprenyl glycosylphosphotransferase [Aquimarina sp. 2201CG5-10]MDY8138689.1 exopolysaccharide biosynthesis polyprenyl glycosylphosphotransferase [Aquimarina sp. 2201CG5-10]
MHHKRGGYSYLIRPILMIIDLAILIASSYYFLNDIISEQLYVFLSITWFVSSYLLSFYEVYRFTKVLTILSLLLRQGFLILILLYAYFGLLRINNFSVDDTFRFVGATIGSVGIIKVITYYALKKYRSYLGGNNRNIIIVGNNKSAQQLKSFFEKRKDLGYKVLEVFSNDLPNTISDSFKYLEKEDVDEIYCSVDEISDEVVNEYVKYADQNYSILKFIPNSQRIFSKRLKTDYYEYLPVLSIPDISLNSSTNRALKRIFDIVFSLLVIVLILSWLIPLLYLLIKIESPGPLIYSHRRNGINYKEFVCYKFRSMRHNKNRSDLDQVKKGDDRVTKIGRFMRRTSIDELPQFFNVFFGDMSVVGPRPHMLSYTKDYAKKIDKYNFVFRHSVKPGITGMAQVKGYRGEVENNEDIINRIKYDIFYIENWSVLLDLKIVFETIINIIKGEDKAY